MGKEYSAQYSPVDEADNEDAKLLYRGTAIKPLSKSRFLHVSLWLIHGVLIFITLLFFTLWVRAPLKDDILLYCRWTDGMTEMPYWPITAPANEAIETSIVRFNGSWDRHSPYRGSPSPDLEAAWDRVTADGCILHFAPIEVFTDWQPFQAAYWAWHPNKYSEQGKNLLHTWPGIRKSTAENIWWQ